jgi:hypothetical protein
MYDNFQTLVSSASLLPAMNQNRGSPLGLVYFFGIFTFEEYGDIWEFGIHPIFLNYTFP